MRALVMVALGLLLVAVACASTPEICTPANSGFGSQPKLVRRDLPAPMTKDPCRPHISAIRSAAELQHAYEEVGAHIIAEDGGASPPDAIPLPPVDFARETVVVRESTDGHPVSWIVEKDGTITVGSQACEGSGTGTCTIQVFAVEAIATKADSHECESIGCGGGPAGGGG